MRVTVVGAGVIGLSCAIRLRRAGIDAHVVAAATGSATTSAVAAALWYPYLVGPADKVREWGAASLAELCRLAADPATGVHLREGMQLLRRERPRPSWAADVPGFRTVDGGLPAPYLAAWAFSAPVADTSVYLGWLQASLVRLGGTIRVAELASVDQARRASDIVVLATGIGARRLPGDPSVRPVHGQVVRVRAPSVRRWVLDDEHPDGLVYVVPRRDDVVCGGTNAEGDGPAGPDPEVSRLIMRRCVEVVPELAGAPAAGAAVGIRPARPTVRVEREDDVIHCYGHGGAGFTLSWGCAETVAELVLG